MKPGESRSATVLNLIPEWTVERIGQCVTCDYSRDKANGAMRCHRHDVAISRGDGCTDFKAAPEATSDRNRRFVESVCPDLI